MYKKIHAAQIQEKIQMTQYLWIAQMKTDLIGYNQGEKNNIDGSITRKIN